MASTATAPTPVPITVEWLADVLHGRNKGQSHLSDILAAFHHPTIELENVSDIVLISEATWNKIQVNGQTLSATVIDLLKAKAMGNPALTTGLNTPTKQARQSVSSLTPTTQAALDTVIADVENMKLQRISNSITVSSMAEWYNKFSHPPVKFWFSKTAKTLRNDFFTRMANHKFISEHGASESKKVQPTWTRLVPKLRELSHLTVHPFSSPGKQTIGSRKPDLPCYLAGQTRSIYYLAVVGELKGARDSHSFTAEEKGQLASFLGKLLQMTHRPFCFGFLSDGKIIQFFRGAMDSTEFSIRETSVEVLNINGGYYLLELLSQKPTDLGYSDEIDIAINNKFVTIEDYLGHGGCSVVYKGKYTNNDVVVKCFHEDKYRYAEVERRMLEKVQSLGSSVPHVVEYIQSRGILILDSVGISFVGENAPRITRNLFCDLISVLEGAHEKQVIHRDLKIQNFFRRVDDPNKVLLNDWSAAASSAEETVVQGTPALMPSYLLELAANNEYTPQASDDLESFVKMFYCYLFPNDPPPNTLKKLTQFWQSVATVRYWESLFQLAYSCDYVGMKGAIQDICK